METTATYSSILTGESFTRTTTQPDLEGLAFYPECSGPLVTLTDERYGIIEGAYRADLYSKRQWMWVRFGPFSNPTRELVPAGNVASIRF